MLHIFPRKFLNTKNVCLLTYVLLSLYFSNSMQANSKNVLTKTCYKPLKFKVHLTK